VRRSIGKPAQQFRGKLSHIQLILLDLNLNVYICKLPRRRIIVQLPPLYALISGINTLPTPFPYVTSTRGP
jgi:hypothetical protein